MVELGVRLEDKPGKPATWKLEDRETLRKEQQEKVEKEREVKLRKLENKVREKKKEYEKWQSARPTPAEYFSTGANAGKYTSDREGNLPVKTANGEEISKKAKKNVEAELKKHEKLHEELLQKAKGSSIDAFLAGVEKELHTMEAELKALSSSS